ncbi:hypothetical protein GOV12_07380, partial [Candidatus Pacearchaeota archaeon]|nr:hypothetical protein [Candidatus Pacearchaeota archaeon]
LSSDEKILLYLFTKYPESGNYNISMKCNISRQKVSKIKKKFIKNDTMRVVNIPNFLKINLDVFAFTNTRENKNMNIKSDNKNDNFLEILGDNERYYLSFHNSYGDFKNLDKNLERNIKFEFSIPVQAIKNISFSFAPLLKKLFSIEKEY